MPTATDEAVYRALQEIALGRGVRAPAGATCRIGGGRCPSIHTEGHIEVEIPEAEGKNVTGKGGTPWTNARWQSRPANAQSTTASQRFYPLFTALSDARLKGDPVMPRSDGDQTVVLRLPSQAVTVLRNALDTPPTET